jgi:hypothetical protein
MVRRLSCLVCGGHHWQTFTDAAGSISSCARCGRTRHRRPFVGDTFFRTHTNLGYKLELREWPGRDELDEDPRR